MCGLLEIVDEMLVDGERRLSPSAWIDCSTLLFEVLAKFGAGRIHEIGPNGLSRCEKSAPGDADIGLP